MLSSVSGTILNDINRIQFLYIINCILNVYECKSCRYVSKAFPRREDCLLIFCLVTNKIEKFDNNKLDTLEKQQEFAYNYFIAERSDYPDNR